MSICSYILNNLCSTTSPKSPTFKQSFLSNMNLAQSTIPLPTQSISNNNTTMPTTTSNTSASADSSSSKIKVMIIDDNNVNLAILSRLLEKYFSDTVQLTSVLNSGTSALDFLSRDEVDLILMDIDMPILSGVQTTREIRSNSNVQILERNKNVPIIAVTTSDNEAQRELYRQVGMSDTVSKPIALPKLRHAIEQAMKSIPTTSVG